MAPVHAPLPPNVSFPALEEEVLARWRERDVFQESMRRRTGAPPFVFYEGPPTANGRPGIHHVWARLFKDLYPRFQTMRGRHVARKGGWDCHGLPVEVQVEHELGIHNKHEIEAYGIAEFNRLCRESVHRYVADFEALTRRIGMWLDTDDAYWTLDNSFIETVWWNSSSACSDRIPSSRRNEVAYLGNSSKISDPAARSLLRRSRRSEPKSAKSVAIESALVAVTKKR